jgi:plasmid maintenance system antidote protein VapI
MSGVVVVPTLDDLNAEIGRRRAVLYRLATAVSLHPSRLSLYLNGHVPLTPDLALRIKRALERPEVTRGR